MIALFAKLSEKILLKCKLKLETLSMSGRSPKSLWPIAWERSDSYNYHHPPFVDLELNFCISFVFPLNATLPLSLSSFIPKKFFRSLVLFKWDNLLIFYHWNRYATKISKQMFEIQNIYVMAKFYVCINVHRWG